MCQRQCVIGPTVTCLSVAGRSGVAAVTAALIAILVAATELATPGSAAAAGQTRPATPTTRDNCRTTMNPTESLRVGGYRAPDGKLHFRVVYDDNVDVPQRMAFQRAMTMWNRYSAVTRIVLKESAARDADFRVRRGAPALRSAVRHSTCASYESNGSYFWYSETGMEWVLADLGAAARIYAHEIGHALNLAHKDGYSVMREGTTVDNCYELGSSTLAEVQPADAEDVRRCAHAMHVGERPAQPPRR